MPAVDYGSGNTVKNRIAEISVALPANGSYCQLWCDYVLKLTGVFCSFLPSSEYIKSDDVDLSTGRIAVPISSSYGELSIRWVMRVLQTVFPCIKACSNQNELTSHLRLVSYNYMCNSIQFFVSFVGYCFLYISTLLPLKYKLPNFFDKISASSQTYYHVVTSVLIYLCNFCLFLIL